MIKYIKNVSYDKSNKITETGYIKKDEIIDYVELNKIELNKWDIENCISPLLYK